MKKIFTFFSVLLTTITFSSYGQIFWVENFESGSTAGELVTAYTGPNGAWTLTITGTEGTSPNVWYVSCAENGHTTGVCGTGCAAVSPTATLATLHVGSTTLGDLGASYDVGGVFNTTTDRRAESPTINCTGKYGITMKFYYIMDGQPAVDYATIWYSANNGTTWTLLDSPPTTPPICPGGQGYWDARSVVLPLSANNNPNVKIGFRWVNNNDGIGTDPSFAVDSVSLNPSSTVVPVASYTVASGYTLCQDSCELFKNTSTGPIDSLKWSATGASIDNPRSDTTTICFAASGVYTVTMTAYRSGTPYTATHVVTVNPTPHPVIHYSGVHTLSVTGTGYTGYQWLNGLSPISGATTNTYTSASSGTYYVIVDSDGCPGISAAFTFSTTGIYGINAPVNNYWLFKNPTSGKITLHSGMPLEANINVMVYDAAGRVLHNEVWLQGATSKDIDDTEIAPGFYFIRFADQLSQHVMKWVK